MSGNQPTLHDNMKLMQFHLTGALNNMVNKEMPQQSEFKRKQQYIFILSYANRIHWLYLQLNYTLNLHYNFKAIETVKPA